MAQSKKLMEKHFTSSSKDKEDIKELENKCKCGVKFIVRPKDGKADGDEGGKRRMICKRCDECKLCMYRVAYEEINICDTCKEYICIKCLNGTRIDCECEEISLSYHQFCTEECHNVWRTRYILPCDDGCFTLLSERKETMRYRGRYLGGVH